MKKRYTVNIAVAAMAAVLAACGSGAPSATKEAASGKNADSLLLLYPRPQSRIVVMEAPGVIRYDNRDRAILPARVAGRIEKLHIRYNYQPVRKGQLVLEIYAPELVAAQREMLALSGDPAMEKAAVQKLLLMGMPESTVQEVLRSRQVRVTIPLYSNADGYILEEAAAAIASSAPAAAPAGGDGMANMSAAAPAAATAAPAPAASPVMLREGQYVSAGQNIFTIYKSGRMIAEFALPADIAAAAAPGSRLLIGGMGTAGELRNGTIGTMEPLYANGEKFSRARVYLSGQYPVGQLLTAYLPVLFKEGSWVPNSALIRLGKEAVVFQHGPSGYRAVTVRTGAQAGGMTQLLSDVQGIASNAAYIADSEGFIRPESNNQPSHP